MTVNTDPARAMEHMQANVRQAASENLVTALLALTHRMHEAPSKGVELELRWQRDVVEAEILRRMGDYS